MSAQPAQTLVDGVQRHRGAARVGSTGVGGAPDYNSASNRVDMEIQTGVGAVDVR